MSRLKPFKLTHVLFEEEDPLGELMAFMTISPVLVAFGLGVAFLVTRQLPWAWSLLGALVVDGLCSLLKKVIDQPRPPGSYRDGPGMPSEHAAFSFFLATHLSLWVCFQLKATRCGNFGNFALKALAILAFLAWSSIVSISRYHLGVHSTAQILCGAVLGGLFALLWYMLEMQLMKKLLESLQGGIIKLWSTLGVTCDGYHGSGLKSDHAPRAEKEKTRAEKDRKKMKKG